MHQINTTRLAEFRWEHEGVLHDVDGSLTGSGRANTMLLPLSRTLPRHNCAAAPELTVWGYKWKQAAALCNGVRFRCAALLAGLAQRCRHQPLCFGF